MRWKVMRRIVKEGKRIKEAKKTGVLKMGEGRKKKKYPHGEKGGEIYEA